MGYYSNMIATSFVSLLNPQKMSKQWKQYLNSQNNNDMHYLEIYKINLIKKIDDYYEYAIEMDDYYAKHYASDSLATFVQTVIAPQKYCVIEFEGEDSSKWGYLILNNSVYNIDYVAYVAGMPMHDFIKQMNAEQ